jgi:hypothetical protein
MVAYRTPSIVSANTAQGVDERISNRVRTTEYNQRAHVHTPLRRRSITHITAMMDKSDILVSSHHGLEMLHACRAERLTDC